MYSFSKYVAPYLLILYYIFCTDLKPYSLQYIIVYYVTTPGNSSSEPASPPLQTFHKLQYICLN